jgi:hypothetical protein
MVNASGGIGVAVGVGVAVDVGDGVKVGVGVKVGASVDVAVAVGDGVTGVQAASGAKEMQSEMQIRIQCFRSMEAMITQSRRESNIKYLTPLFHCAKILPEFPFAFRSGGE